MENFNSTKLWKNFCRQFFFFSFWALIYAWPWFVFVFIQKEKIWAIIYETYGTFLLYNFWNLWTFITKACCFLISFRHPSLNFQHCMCYLLSQKSCVKCFREDGRKKVQKIKQLLINYVLKGLRTCTNQSSRWLWCHFHINPNTNIHSYCKNQYIIFSSLFFSFASHSMMKISKWKRKKKTISMWKNSLNFWMIIRKILLFHKLNFRFSFSSRWSKSSSFSLSPERRYSHFIGLNITRSNNDVII